MSLFYTTLDRAQVEVRLIHKMGRHAVDSNQVFFDGLEVPEEDRIGTEGQGFRYLLDSLNPERVLVGIEAVGIGQWALGRAADYARERVVFGRKIGQNQGIQHPLAVNWIELENAFYAVCEQPGCTIAGSHAGRRRMRRNIAGQTRDIGPVCRR